MTTGGSFSSTTSATVRAFIHACETADQGGLLALLDPDVTMVIDTGGRVRAPVAPVHGAGRVTQLLIDSLAKQSKLVQSERAINGHAGIVMRLDARVISIVSLGYRLGFIRNIWVVANPDKLRRWNGY